MYMHPSAHQSRPQPLFAICTPAPVVPQQATDAWELLNSMLSAAKDAVRAADSQLGTEEQEAALQALAVVKGHVTAARLLTKHGLTTPVR